MKCPFTHNPGGGAGRWERRATRFTNTQHHRAP